MTINEAIKYCEEIAEKYEKLCEANDDFNFSQPKWKQTANDYRQIAEYLKRYRYIVSLLWFDI